MVGISLWCRRFAVIIATSFIRSNAIFLTILLYGDIWTLRNRLKSKWNKFEEFLYYAYLERYGAWIGIRATIESKPILPHGLFGIFISHSAYIGKNCVIFQQVTIGSNTLKDSKKFGAPKIADNVYIGCGAKLIGNINVGENARIGANCIVVKDVPPNSVAIMGGAKIIVKDYPLDNHWIQNNY